MRRRCLDWLSSHPGDLWTLATARKVKRLSPKDAVDAPDALPDSTVNQVCPLIQEGALRRACPALLQDNPVEPTDEVDRSYGTQV